LVRQLRNFNADVNVKNSISYKNCSIYTESFQREKNGSWIPQYTVTLPETGRKPTDFPSHQYQFNEAFPTESDADEYALRRAREWVDQN
jgi:hypothetical protein